MKGRAFRGLPLFLLPFNKLAFFCVLFFFIEWMLAYVEEMAYICRKDKCKYKKR